MSRLFWVGTGVVLTVVVIVKGRQIILRYTPAAVADRATATVAATGSALSDAATHFLADFRAARDERAKELADALLAPTQGSVEDLQARRDTYSATHRTGAHTAGTSAGTSAGTRSTSTPSAAAATAATAAAAAATATPIEDVEDIEDVEIDRHGPGWHTTAADTERATRARYAPATPAPTTPVDDDSEDDELGYSF